MITALSLVMMLVVSYARIQPGVAFGSNTEVSAYKNNVRQLMAAGSFTNPWFDEVVGSIDEVGGAVQIKDEYVTSFDPLTFTAVDGAKACDVSVNLNYVFPPSAVLDIINSDSHCVYFNINTNADSGIQIQQNGFSGPTMVSVDPNYLVDPDSICGYYSISREGLIVLRFTDDYIDYLKENPGRNLTGMIKFNGKVDRADTADGDRVIEIAGQQLKVEFSDDVASMTKYGSVVKGDDGKKYIEWNITIINPDKHLDLTGYTLTDILTVTGDQTMTDDTMLDNDVLKQYGTFENGVFTFTTTPDTDNLTFTYRQEAQNGTTSSNHAVLKDDKGNTLSDLTPEKTIDNKLEVNKYDGVPDYHVDGETPNGVIHWQVDVTNLSTDPLSNVCVEDELFPSDGSLKVYSYDGSLVDSSLYTVENGKLTFTESTDIPYRVTIKYDSTAGLGDTVTNTATASSIVTDGPEEGSDTGTATYQDETFVVKRGDGFDPITEKVKWKIRVLSGMQSVTVNDNGGYTIIPDGQSKQTVNGFEVTDPVFAKMSDAEIAAISYNAHKEYNGYEEDRKGGNESAVTFSRKEGHPDTIIIHTDLDINEVEMYFSQDVTTVDNFDADKYNNDEQQTAVNTALVNAPGIMDGEGTGTQLYQAQCDARKVCNNAEEVSSFEQIDNKELEWQIELTKHNGFGKGTNFLTDTLNANNGGLHYITPEQAAAITLSTADGIVSDDDYDLVFYTSAEDQQNGTGVSASDLTGNAIAFKIQFKDSISKEIKNITVNYNTTADVQQVGVGNESTFTNSYKFGSNEGTVTGFKFERKDPSKVELIYLNARKTWNDSYNAAGFRPKSIKFRVEQALADEHGDPPTSASAWKTVKGKADNYLESPNEISGEFNQFYDYDVTYGLGYFPQWKVSEDGSVTRYYYRIVEEPVDRYSASYENNVIYANDDLDTGTAYVTNTLSASYSKSAIDKNGNTVEEVRTSELPVATINVGGNPTRCYMIRWGITVSSVGDYVDTIPEGMYYVGSDCELEEYRPKAITTWNGEYPVRSNNGNWSDAEVNGNTVTFKVFKTSEDQTPNYSVNRFRYYTAIPVDSIDDVLVDEKLTNTVRKSGDTGAGVTAEVDVVNDYQPNQLSKSGRSSTAIAGRLTYTLDVNPDGANLSNSDTYTITDLLTIAQSNAPDIRFTLTDVKVYPVINGEKSAEPINNFRYRVVYNTEADINTPVNFNYSNSTYYTEDLNDEKVVFRIKGTAGQVLNDTHIYTEDQYGGQNNKLDIQNVTIGADGYADVTYTVPSGIKRTCVGVGGNDSGKVSDVEVISRKQDVAAKMEITVPDGQHYKIEYIYQGSGFEKSLSTNVVLNNTAEIHADNGKGWDKQDGVKMNTQDTDATNTIQNYPEIHKVDVNDYKLDLNATFVAAKLVDGQWIYANAVETVGVIGDDDGLEKRVYRQFRFDDSSVLKESDGNFPTAAAQLVFDDKGNATAGSPTGTAFNVNEKNKTKSYLLDEDRVTVHDFLLEPNTIYKFIEVQAPAGYLPAPTGNKLSDFAEHTFYYNYDGADDSALPADVDRDRVISVVADSAVRIPNSRDITIKAEKTFSGSAAPSVSTVVFELLESESGTLTDAKPVAGGTKTLNYSTASADNTATWEELPSGRNGTPLYYFVREKSYTINNVTYTYDSASGQYLDSGGSAGPFKPVYSGNGTNTNNSVIEVNNTNDLVVRKVWLDANGDPIPADKIPTDVGSTAKMAVRFDLFGINSKGGKVKIELGDDAVLNSDNAYTYTVPADKLGDFTNFEISEKLTNEQKAKLGSHYKYTTNKTIQNGVGELELINQDMTPDKVKATVTKKWRPAPQSDETVKVQLVKTRTEQTGETLRTLDSSKYTVVEEEITLDTTLTYSRSDLPYADDGGRWYYYFIETSTHEGYTAFYDVTDTDTEIKTDITNIQGAKITVEKQWAGDTDLTDDDKALYIKPVTVELFRSTDKNSGYVTTGRRLVLDEEHQWRGVFNGLEEKDGSGNTYYYRVQEVAVGDDIEVSAGATRANCYTINYDNNDLTVSEDRTVTITNTIDTIKLKLIKDWADKESQSHDGDNVTLTLRRSTAAEDAPTDLEPIIGGGGDNTVTKEIGEQIKGYASHKYQIGDLVTSITLTFGDIMADEYATISVNSEYVYSSIKVGNFKFSNGNIVASENGSIPFECSENTITINYPSPTLVDNISIWTGFNDPNYWTVESISYEKMTIPDNAEVIDEILPEQGLKKFNLKGKFGSDVIKDGSIVIFDLEGKPNATLKASLVDDNWVYRDKMTNFDSDGKCRVIYQISGDMTVSTLDIYDYYDDVKISQATLIPPTTVTQSNTRSSFSALRANDQHIYRAGALSLLADGETEYQKNLKSFTGLMSVPDGEWSQEVTISSADSWQVIKDLPKYSPDGLKYYYWAEETKVNGRTVAGYVPSYKFDDGDNSTQFCINSENLGKGTVTVLNTPTENEGIILPETGGAGTRGLYMAGGAAAMLSAMGYIRFRRRRKSE
ncbi:LPXTG-motif cell wall anchor domain protein [Ruminococcus albus 8]|uniref:LPXTG-motif cell wall anchor domain protein n=1 Tax=Ruminococcus albus 8 TaxID=246199 RepID=E9SCR3_RUMAL|nr:LPXTG-motif cell wall anchor domain protein [Ruminococcus albus 8]